MFRFVPAAAAALTSKLKGEKKKSGRRKIACDHKGLLATIFCLMHLLCVFVLLLAGTGLTSRKEPFVPSLSSDALVQQMRRVCRAAEALAARRRRSGIQGGGESTASPRSSCRTIAEARERLILLHPTPPPPSTCQRVVLFPKKKIIKKKISWMPSQLRLDDTELRTWMTRRLQSRVFHCEVDTKFHIHL